MEQKNIWIWVLAAAALIFLFGSFGMHGYGWWGFGMGFWFLCMILFWGALMWIVTALINSSKSGKNADDLSTILKRRYASGEISKKQYEKIKKYI